MDYELLAHFFNSGFFRVYLDFLDVRSLNLLRIGIVLGFGSGQGGFFIFLINLFYFVRLCFNFKVKRFTRLFALNCLGFICSRGFLTNF